VAGACVPGTQHPGSEGRNAFNATSYTNFDFSVTKLSHLTEKLTMELRADVFNIFNHANFSNPLLPGFSVDAFSNNHAAGNRLLGGLDPNGFVNGTSGPLNGPQYVQTQATPDVGSGNPYLGGGGPRTMQLAAHFNF
jgi:hypothetical protein